MFRPAFFRFCFRLRLKVSRLGNIVTERQTKAKICGRMLGANPARVLVEHHVQYPVHRLNAPVAQDACHKFADLRQAAAQKVSTFRSTLAN